ncbi:PREDICTED: Retrovirus-related Pol poly from transposon, partial [Prunus dulcis]
WKPEEDAELVPLDPDKPERKARIGSRLSHEEKIELAAFLRNNKDVFAWSPSDMPGIDLQIICHRLHVNPAIKLVAQKRLNFAPERVAIIEAEIDKLLAAGFIQEVSYVEWLANVVLVAKKDKGLWRVCVDYTDLNKACPKDNFPLPRIDQLVDSTSGNQLLSFMDAYSGYNQIMMHEDDKAKTSFIIERGTYCYKVMPFGLKNAGATYQRLVNKIFKEQIGKTMEVYVDDMLVKAPERADHIKNLAEAFSLLRKYNMKLNPSKCTFGVSSGRFLGYLVTQRGIEAHPNQIKAILNMKSPATTKEIQSLTGRAAALNRFLSRSTDKCRPFFKALKKGHRDKWDDECEVAFQNLKTYLTSPPLLSKPIPGEDLYIYLAVSDSAVSSALIREELGAQHP